MHVAVCKLFIVHSVSFFFFCCLLWTFTWFKNWVHWQKTCIHMYGALYICSNGWLNFSFIHSKTTLHGHTMAVTSVDWKKISGVTILATCSDDRVSLCVDNLLHYNKWQRCKWCPDFPQRHFLPLDLNLLLLHQELYGHPILSHPVVILTGAFYEEGRRQFPLSYPFTIVGLLVHLLAKCFLQE